MPRAKPDQTLSEYLWGQRMASKMVRFYVPKNPALAEQAAGFTIDSDGRVVKREDWGN